MSIFSVCIKMYMLYFDAERCKNILNKISQFFENHINTINFIFQSTIFFEHVFFKIY